MTQQQLTSGLLKPARIHHKMPPMTSQLGKIIKARLAEIGNTQEWLAEQVGVSKTAVSKWIRTGQVSRANAIEVSRQLGISSDQLLRGEPVTDVSLPNRTTLDRLDADEKRVLDLYRAATKDGKMMILGAATVAPKDESLSVPSPH